jgi:hypothetical protein
MLESLGVALALQPVQQLPTRAAAAAPLAECPRLAPRADGRLRRHGQPQAGAGTPAVACTQRSNLNRAEAIAAAAAQRSLHSRSPLCSADPCYCHP